MLADKKFNFLYIIVGKPKSPRFSLALSRFIEIIVAP